MRLPRGLQTGGVPTGPVAIESPLSAAAELADSVADLSDNYLEDQARAEVADFSSAADAQARKFVNRLRLLSVDADTDKPIFETAQAETESLFKRLEKAAGKRLTSGRARGRVHTELAQLRESVGVQVDSIVQEKRFEYNHARNTRAIERNVELGEFEKAGQILQDAKQWYSAEQFSKLGMFILQSRDAAQLDQQVSAIAAQAMSIRAQQNPEAAAAYLQQVRAGNIEGLTEEAREAGVRLGLAELRQAEDLENRANATEDTLRRVERSIGYNRFLRGITSATQDVEIEAFARQTAITDQGKIRALFSARDKKREAQAVFDTEYIDPTSRKVRDLVDVRLNEVFSDPQQRLSASIEIAQDTGIAASSLERYFEGGSRSPEAFVEAATRYRTFREAAPAAYLPLSDGTKALFSQAATLSRAGMDAVLAANTAWEIVNNSTPEQIQDRLNNYPADEIVGEVISDLNDIPGLHKPGLFVDRTADVPAEMAGDMNRIGLAVYQRTGSIDAARDAVRNNIVNAWQFTDVNEGVSSGDTELDSQYMKFAPRRGAKFVRKRLAEELGEQKFFFDNQVQPVDPSRIELWQPPLPEKNEFGQPVWTLRVDGQFLLDERGQVVRWTYELPPGTEKPIRKEPEVTPAGFISLPAQKNATGTIKRGFN